jgi:hypothetical protein
MKRQIFFTIFVATQLFVAIHLSAQVGINTDNSAPDNSAMLDVKSTTKGFLPPRVALTAINSANPVTAPATGLLVYNTASAGTPPNNVIVGYYYWNGAKWIAVVAPQGANAGDMLYWNGTQWISIPAGSNGQVLTFNNGVPTWGGVQIPIVSTTAISNITGNSANSGGNVTSDGGSPVTARGVCWNITSNPTTSDNHTTDGSGTGSFVSNLTGLSVSTLYYVRAYATNSAGTSYGNQVSFTTLQFYIGQSYGGGIIFYIDITNQHGLIATSSDQSTNAQWGCWGNFIGGTSTNIGTGQANTTAIINGCGAEDIAADICDDLVLNGYSDWYLPSKDELNQMYIQKNVIGGNPYSTYWSSSEYSAFNAYVQDFSNGVQGNSAKNNTLYVRAIRSF